MFVHSTASFAVNYDVSCSCRSSQYKPSHWSQCYGQSFLIWHHTATLVNNLALTPSRQRRRRRRRFRI